MVQYVFQMKNSPMKSLTIHNMEQDLIKAIEQLAGATGLSQNKVVKKLLRKALGLEGPKEPHRDFSAFCGLWSSEEAEIFEKAVRSFEQIDKELWQ